MTLHIHVSSSSECVWKCNSNTFVRRMVCSFPETQTQWETWNRDLGHLGALPNLLAGTTTRMEIAIQQRQVPVIWRASLGRLPRGHMTRMRRGTRITPTWMRQGTVTTATIAARVLLTRTRHRARVVRLAREPVAHFVVPPRGFCPSPWYTNKLVFLSSCARGYRH